MKQKLNPKSPTHQRITFLSLQSRVGSRLVPDSMMQENVQAVQSSCSRTLLPSTRHPLLVTKNYCYDLTHYHNHCISRGRRWRREAPGPGLNSWLDLLSMQTLPDSLLLRMNCATSRLAQQKLGLPFSFTPGRASSRPCLLHF